MTAGWRTPGWRSPLASQKSFNFFAPLCGAHHAEYKEVYIRYWAWKRARARDWWIWSTEILQFEGCPKTRMQAKSEYGLRRERRPPQIMFLNCTSQNTEKPSVSINELPGIHPSYFSYDIWLHSLDHILIWQWFCNMIFIERIKRSFSLCSRWLSKICFLLLIAGMCWTLNRPIFMTIGLYPQRVRTVIRSNSHIPVQRIFLCSGTFLLLSLFLAGINFRSICHTPQQSLQCLLNPVSPSPFTCSEHPAL